MSVPRLTGGHLLEKPCVLWSEPGLESGAPDVQSDAFHKTSLLRGRAVDGCVSEDLEFGYFWLFPRVCSRVFFTHSVDRCSSPGHVMNQTIL